jgi:hypothetical protein
MRIVRNESNSEGRYEAARIILSYVEPDQTMHCINGQQKALQLAVELGDAEISSLLEF